MLTSRHAVRGGYEAFLGDSASVLRLVHRPDGEVTKWSAFLSWLAVVQMTPSVAFSIEPPATEVPGAARRSEPAEGWFREALEAYDRGDFEIAAHLFRAVYEVTHSPEVLYDLAQAERKAGQCSAALAHYEQYVQLDSGKAPEDIAQKMDEMHACTDRTQYQAAAEVPASALRTELAEGWFREALEAYDRGDFEIAAHLFRAVYQATHSPEVLYDLAQAERKAGQCNDALAHYQEYVRLESRHAPHDIAGKIAEMRACADRTQPRSEATVALPPPSSLTPPEKRPPSRPNHTLRVVAFGTAAGAVVSAALGGLQLLEARSARNGLESIQGGDEWNAQYASYEDTLERANRAAAGMFITAGVLAATATVTFVLSRPRGDNPPTTAVRAGIGGHGVSLAISF